MDKRDRAIERSNLIHALELCEELVKLGWVDYIHDLECQVKEELKSLEKELWNDRNAKGRKEVSS